MKKLLLLCAMILAFCITARALPFEPTTDPSSSSTKWYHLKTEGLYVGSNNIRAIVTRTSSNTSDQLWCFVGTSSTGYKVYNKKYGKYIGDDGYLVEIGSDEEYSINYYKQRQGDTFYLMRSYYDDGANIFFYLYYDSEDDELLSFATTSSVTKGSFEAILEPNPAPDTPGWTRYDTNGIGYKVIGGGTSSISDQSTDKLCDNNTVTKYCGTAAECWVIIEASSNVSVRQYSIVTADDSRKYAERAPRSWKLQGSRDNYTWYDIDEHNDSPLMPFADQTEVVFYLNHGTAYRYFKFTCTAGATPSTVQISEIWINEQAHNWSESTNTLPTCGVHGTKTYTCSDCKANKEEIIAPTEEHNYENGKCTVCNKLENETILLANGQVNPYTVKHLFAYQSNGIWPSAPEGWNSVDFDDSKWEEMSMPTASIGHSNGPFSSLRYNSYWYGEYNCHWFRRPFYVSNFDSNSTFKFRCVHDDNMVVYVNGVEVINAQGWTNVPNKGEWSNSYEEFTIPASAFTKGKNVLAVYIQQNYGGAYFDCELAATGLSAQKIVGDVNGDGVVNTGDVSALYAVIINGQNDPDCDLNDDGMVNTGDISALYSIILNGGGNIIEYTVNGVKFKMVDVEGGTFNMGADESDTNAWPYERPVHQVTLSSFAIGMTEVTQELWEAVMSSNPSNFTDPKQPVERVSWNDCQAFIARLSAIIGKQFRLPTEAEWEYAARGGNKSKGYLYSGSNNVNDVAWYSDNCYGLPQAVATKAANELGLYDMSGNVEEWCNDWYFEYEDNPVTNPTGPSDGLRKVTRGGSCSDMNIVCRNTFRREYQPTSITYSCGFRLAM